MTRWRSALKLFFAALALVCGAATLFFTWYGVQLVYTAVTFDGEGSLGHVGMYIAAGLFPLLAFLFAGLTYLAWRSAGRSSRVHSLGRDVGPGRT